MSGWTVAAAYPHLQQAFGSLDAVFALVGKRLTRDPLSEVIRVEIDGIGYYVKRYVGAGKGLRRYVGRPRVKAEWQNLRHFARWGVATAPIVAWGLERHAGAFRRGALITQEIVGSKDLAHLAATADPRFGDAAWVRSISQQLAQATRALHDHRFAHNDLKWRNLLVDEAGVLYFIDCPSGAFWSGPLLRRRIIKDLACLDKVAKSTLSRSQRLRFYLQYCGRSSLLEADKQQVRRIVGFFEGRE
ncbi:lipopolysaccharide kinase InaA family protein [Pseudomonas borbori]